MSLKLFSKDDKVESGRSSLLCSIRDIKQEIYGTPVVFLNEAVARRTFKDEVNNPQSSFSRHPEDYQLFVLGHFFEISGLVVPVQAPVYVCAGSDLVSSDAAL